MCSYYTYLASALLDAKSVKIKDFHEQAGLVRSPIATGERAWLGNKYQWLQYHKLKNPKKFNLKDMFKRLSILPFFILAMIFSVTIYPLVLLIDAVHPKFIDHAND